MRVVIEKPFGTRLRRRSSSTTSCCPSSTSRRSSGSTTTWARRRSRTCWPFASRTACSSRSGTATSSTTCRSPRRRTSASAGAPGYYDGAGALRDLVQNHMLQLLTPAVHGAAGDVRGRRGPRREGEGAARGRAAEARRRGARPVHVGHGGGEGCGRVPRGGGGSDGLHDRDLRGPAARGGQLALGRRADLPPHRQAARPQGHGDRGDPEARAAPRVPGRRIGRCPAEPDHPGDAAERGCVDLARREDPRHSHAHPAGEHGVPLRHVVPVAVPRGVRAADPGRDAWRRDALHPQRRGRGAVADHRSDPRVVGEGRRAARHLPGRLGRAPRRRTRSSRRAIAGGPSSDGAEGGAGGSRRGRRLVGAGHNAERDRRGAAGAVDQAVRAQPGALARARAQPRRGRGPRVARRDHEPARAGGPLPRLAHHPLRRRAEPDHDRRLGGADRRGRAPARSRLCSRASA